MSSENKGLVLLYKGQGEGMTAAALGQAFRSLGRGFAVCFIQFVSESPNHSVFIPTELSLDRIEFHALGRGYSWKPEDRDADCEVALAAWDFAHGNIASGKFDLVVLDEIGDLVVRGLLSEREVVQGVVERHEGVNVIITGPHAPDALIAVADLVTEVKEQRNG